MDYNLSMLQIVRSETFSAWLHELDTSPRARILARIRRIEQLGNSGDWKPVGNGVNELRIAFGPGYRVYFARHGNTVVVLLVGGDKSTQTADIRRAKAIWQQFKEG